MLTDLEISESLRALALRKITREEFLRSLPDDLTQDPQFVQSLISEAASRQDALRLQFALAVARSPAIDNQTDIDATQLCKLLSEAWHFSHEDIASFLAELRSPATVGCLADAVNLRFGYLDYDETFQFARKCIKALAAVNNQSALEKLTMITESPNPVIREYALKELSRSQK
jgi:hypothetical protein